MRKKMSDFSDIWNLVYFTVTVVLILIILLKTVELDS
jgi:low affinity Fe/Cu permease